MFPFLLEACRLAMLLPMCRRCSRCSYRCVIVVLVETSTGVAEQHFFFLWKRPVWQCSPYWFTVVGFVGCCNSVAGQTPSAAIILMEWRKKIQLVVYQIVSGRIVWAELDVALVIAAAITAVSRHRKEDSRLDGTRDNPGLVSTREGELRGFPGAENHQNQVFVANLNRIYAVKIVDFELRSHFCELRVEFISQGIQVVLHFIPKRIQLFLRILALVLIAFHFLLL